MPYTGEYGEDQWMAAELSESCVICLTDAPGGISIASGILAQNSTQAAQASIR